MSKKPRLYSYIRWNTDKQSSGSTHARQLKQARDLATEYDLELVEMIDEGLSSFKGMNKERGALGDFLRACEAGAIAKGSWLVVENLDRLSRAKIEDSVRLLLDLLQYVNIITGMDNQVYRLDANPAEKMVSMVTSIMLFSRANEESETKRKRTNASAQIIIDEHRQGKRAPNGSAYAIKSVGSNVWWSDTTGNTVEKHPKYFEVAQKVAEMMLQNIGNYRIVTFLNENYPPPKAPKQKRDKERWSVNMINKFASSRALIGEKSLKIDDVTEVIPDYYWPVLTEEQFYKLRHIKENKKVTTRGESNLSLVSGLGIAKCGHCGSSMTKYTHRRTGRLRYQCLGGQTQTTSCKAWSVYASLLEDTLVWMCAHKVWLPEEERNRYEEPIAIRSQMLSDIETKLDNASALAMSGNAPATLLRDMHALEAQKIEIVKELDEFKLRDAGSVIEEYSDDWLM
ncbi:recombinase family protein [Motiliproteus coralliicola]|nr:recombinase family protein [Motiliproteus coralliicola]